MIEELKKLREIHERFHKIQTFEDAEYVRRLSRLRYENDDVFHYIISDLITTCSILVIKTVPLYNVSTLIVTKISDDEFKVEYSGEVKIKTNIKRPTDESNNQILKDFLNCGMNLPMMRKIIYMYEKNSNNVYTYDTKKGTSLIRYGDVYHVRFPEHNIERTFKYKKEKDKFYYYAVMGKWLEIKE